MKSSTKESFGLWRKYSKFKNLIVVYIWYIEDESKTVTYALTYGEAFTICVKMGWTQTKSWKEGKGYSTTKPSKKLKELIEPYKMDSNKWWKKIIN